MDVADIVDIAYIVTVVYIVDIANIVDVANIINITDIANIVENCATMDIVDIVNIVDVANIVTLWYCKCRPRTHPPGSPVPSLRPRVRPASQRPHCRLATSTSLGIYRISRK